MNYKTLIYEWVSHYFQSKSNHEIQTNFLIEFQNYVLKGDLNFEVKSEFKTIQKILFKDNSSIHHDDFGAGSKKIKTPNTSISSLSKSSTKSIKEAGLIARLIDFLEPKNVLELGTSFGTTTALIAKTNPELPIYSIEGSPEVAKKAKQYFDSIPNNKIELIIGKFDEILPGLLSKLNLVECVILDGNHRKEPTISYFEQCLKYSNENTFFIFDDIRWSHEMLEAWKEIENNKAATLTIDLFTMGIVFINPKFDKQNIKLRF